MQDLNSWPQSGAVWRRCSEDLGRGGQARFPLLSPAPVCKIRGWAMRKGAVVRKTK